MRPRLKSRLWLFVSNAQRVAPPDCNFPSDITEKLSRCSDFGTTAIRLSSNSIGFCPLTESSAPLQPRVFAPTRHDSHFPPTHSHREAATSLQSTHTRLTFMRFRHVHFVPPAPSLVAKTRSSCFATGRSSRTIPA